MRLCIKYIHVACFILIACACHKMDIRLAEPNADLRSATAFVHNNFAFSLFYAAIERAGMADKLDGPGPFTILAPTNAAFNQWGIHGIDDLDKLPPDTLRRLISLHILNGKHFVEDIPAGTIDNLYYNIDGHKLYFSCNPTPYNGNNYYVNGIPLTPATGKTDIVLSNGLLHETGGLLNSFDGTLADWLEHNGQYKVFIAGLKRFGYWGLLSDTSQSLTILPPSDSVFLSKGVTADQAASLDTNFYDKRLFGVYLFPTRFFRSDLLFFTGRYVDMTPVAGYHARSMSEIYTAVIGDTGWSNGYAADQGYGGDQLFLSKSPPDGDIILSQWATPSLSTGYSGVDKDILTRNGTVQKINQLVLLPQEAIN